MIVAGHSVGPPRATNYLLVMDSVQSDLSQVLPQESEIEADLMHRAPVSRVIMLAPGLPVALTVAVETMALVAYRLWFCRVNADWFALDPRQVDERRSDNWLILPPPLPGSQFAYAVSAWGHPFDCWQVRFTVSQKRFDSAEDSWTMCDSWTDSGLLDASGSAGGGGTLANAKRLRLAQGGFI